MTQAKRRQFLLRALLDEAPRYKNMSIPRSDTEQRQLLRSLINIRYPQNIGAGAGLSTSAGFTYSGERFRKDFADFKEKYGFHDMYSGAFCRYETPEEHWAYQSGQPLCFQKH